MRKSPILPLIFIISIIIAAAIVILAYFMLPQSALLNGGNTQSLLSDWSTTNGQPVYLPGRIEYDDTEETIITRTLPQTLAEGTVLSLKTNYLAVEAYVDGAQIIAWNSDNRTLHNQTIGLSNYFIRIPSSAAGAELELRLSSVMLGGVSRIYDATLDDGISAAITLIQENIYPTVLFFILIIAFCLFLLPLIIFRRTISGDTAKNLLYLSAFMLLSAVWIVSNTNLTLLLTRSVTPLYYSSMFAFMLLPIPVLLYTKRFFTRGKRVVVILTGLILLNFFICVGLFIAGIFSLNQTLITTHILDIVACLAVFVLSMREYIRTKKRDTLEVFIGLGILSLVSLAAGISFYFPLLLNSSLLFDTGLAAFALTLMYGAIRLGSAEIIKSKRFEQLTTHIPSGICHLENFETSHILYANKFYYNMFGYSEREARTIGFTSADFTILPEDLKLMKAKIKRDFAVNHAQFETEARHVTKNGDIIWILSRYTLNCNNYGKITSVMIDITDRKLMEEKLRISEEEYRIATRHSNKMILRFDIKTRVCFRQPGATPDFDLPQVIENFPDVIQNTGLIASDSVSTIRSFFEAIFNGEREGSVIVSMLDRSNDEFRWYHFDFTTIFDNANKPTQAIISYYDITLQRQKELAFQRWQQIYNAIPKANTFYVEYNLTTDYIEHEEGELIPSIPDTVPRKLSAIAEYIANNHLHPDDISLWLEFMSRNRLLENYANSQQTEKTEFRRILDTKTLWTSLSVQLIPDPYSSDVKAYFQLEDITDQKTAVLHLQERSMRDSLTGLLNRGSFVEQFNEVLRKSDPETQHALIMFDIDKFKNINDTLGHTAGDAILVNISNKLKYALRTDDLCGRIGGDEFVICLRHMNLGKPLESRVKDLCSLISDDTVWGLTVTASFGIAGFPYDGLTFDELYQKADMALYAAKANGRGSYAVYDSQLSFDDLSVPNKTAT